MPSAAPATTLLHDRGAQHAEALKWAERGDPVVAVQQPRHDDPEFVLAIGDLTTMSSTSATVAAAVRSRMTFGGIVDIDVVVPRLVVETTRHQVSKPSFADLFQDLRERLRLPVQTYAVLLGTSRRTLYHWLETGRAQEQALWRIERLAEWIPEMEGRFAPAEVRRLMDPDLPDSIATTLIREGDHAAAERLRRLIAATDQPQRARRLPALAVERAGEPPTLGDDEFRAALSVFASARAAGRGAAGWTPRELTDAPADDTT
jgi:hypothetical protein